MITLVPIVILNVELVEILLIIVSFVMVTESELHLVTALMDSSITVTLVLDVLTTVPPVPEETPVPLVLTLELMPQLVNVQSVTGILVTPNVTNVYPDVLNVFLPSSVPFVTTQLKELFQLVIVLTVGSKLTTLISIVLKNHIQKD
jgi:hypothetical protein